MLIAVILAAIIWGYPAPQLWICDPGHSPLTPSNCERLHFTILERARL